MKKLLIALVLLLSVVSFGQAQTTKSYPVEDGKVVYFTIADRNLSTGTVYSDPIDVTGYFNLDSTSLYPLAYQFNDTVYCDISIEGRFASGSTSQWKSLGTVVNNFRGTATDTLYNKSLVSRGSFSYDSNVLSFAGAYAQQIRVKVVFDSGVGDDGSVKMWLLLPKKRYVSFKNNP